MVYSFETRNGDELANQIINHSSFRSSWFDLRVFYVRIINFEVDKSTPEFLTLNHIPLSPYTHLEVNGATCDSYSAGVSSLLRRDRIDKKSEEATYVGTDSIRLNGSVKFEVFDKEKLILSGVLDMSNSNGFTGESKNTAKKWSMNCESKMTYGSGVLNAKQSFGPDLMSPMIEVYVAGSSEGTPIILTETIQLSFRKKQSRKSMLEAIPEHATAEAENKKEISSSPDLQVVEYRKYKPENEEIYYRRTEYIEGDDGELSWFNAGVRVGVGIGLGVCVGLGLGVGLLFSTYQSTTRTFKKRLF